MHQTEHMSVAQAALELGVSRWTVVRHIKAGRLPAQKLGEATSAWLLARTDVEAFSKDDAA